MQTVIINSQKGGSDRTAYKSPYRYEGKEKLMPLGKYPAKYSAMPLRMD